MDCLIEDVLSAFRQDCDEHLIEQLNDVLEALFSEARALIAREFSGEWTNDLPAALKPLEEAKAEFIDRLSRKIRLRNLNLGKAQNMRVQVTGSQNVSIVIGAVDTTIQQIIQRGGTDKEIAGIVHELLEIVKCLDDRHEAEKAELVQLTKGLVRELEQPKSERNLSTMLVVLERIEKVGSAIGAAGELAHFFTERFPELLRLLGFGS